MVRNTSTGGRRFARLAVLIGAAVAAALPAMSATAADRAPGTGRPPAGSGINRQAALANPRCDQSDEPYGRLDFVTKGGGPVCVAEWKRTNNGGATYQGVTKDSIKAIAIVPNDQQLAATPRQGLPTNYATGQPGTVQDALGDALAGFEHSFGGTYTYGRDIDLEFVVSTGDDEAAQRADAVTVKAAKPFVVIDATNSSLSVFDTEIAAAKIPVFSLNAKVDETLQQAPYRWGQTDPTAGTINGAEFIGKQVAGRKAQYAGDPAMHDQTRKLGLVRTDVVDTGRFYETLAEYDVKIAPAATISYPGTTSTLGDPAVAQEQAPVAITKLKAAGVTTVILLADSAMTGALTRQATAQEYRPEWIFSGTQNIDLPLLARGYDQDQWAHAFGISNVPPGAPVAPTTTPNVIQWYWGPGNGTFGIAYTNAIDWLVTGIMYAGPRLSPKSLEQGFFAIPALGGSASGNPELATRTTRSGYGRTNGLPYKEYMRGNKDFTASWWDSDTDGPPMLGFPGGKGTLWYLDDAQRYYAGAWPTKPLPLFDKSKAMNGFDAPATPLEVLPCEGCPSESAGGGAAS